ncbi:MAG: HDIG domain-containing metalloprotein [Thermodesulfobacteriota bacterium]
MSVGSSIAHRTRLRLLGKGKPSRKGERDRILLSTKKRSLWSLLGTERLRWILIAGLSIVLSVLLFPSVLLKPVHFRLGDVAERDIKASRDFLVENKEFTERDREKAAREVLAVYDFDPSAGNHIPTLKEAWGFCQTHLARPLDKDEDLPVSGKAVADPPLSPEALKSRLFEILKMPHDEKLFRVLLKHGFPTEVEEAVSRVLAGIYEKGVVTNRGLLKGQIDRGGIILHEILTKRESAVTDINRFYDLERARSFLRTQVNPVKEMLSASELADPVLKLATFFLVPNLTFNQRETELRREAARQAVKPTYYKIKRGEMLVREGERIGQEHLVKLSEEMQPGHRIDLISRVPAMAVLLGALLSAIYLVGLSGIHPTRSDVRYLIFNAACLFGFFLILWTCGFVAEGLARDLPHISSRSLLFALPVPCAAMLVSVFQGLRVAVAFSLVLSVLGALITGGKVEFFIYFFVGSLVAAHGVRNCSERGILIKTGLLVGLVNVFLSLSVGTIHESLYTWENLVASVSGFAGGVLCGVIATGVLPLVEMGFGFTTDIKLLELSNLDQPLLRDLMVQAPGTYHHSVIISNMVEATAKAVQARPLLAKVSAYYHDIGKMTKPLYFIENQMGGENKHEKLAPSMSGLILISHVKDGVELAKEHKLGREIIDIIQQHHGTTLITYFYQKAKDRMAARGERSSDVKEEDYRYPGLKPQTKEAGLVMLADMVEAASRSLVDPTPARIQGMVQKIINNVFSDGQLDDCELTLKDLHEIAKSFNKTLSGIFHHRIEYPEVVTKPVKKAKNGHTDQGGSEDSGAKKQEDKGETEEGLKRLGLS